MICIINLLRCWSCVCHIHTHKHEKPHWTHRQMNSICGDRIAMHTYLIIWKCRLSSFAGWPVRPPSAAKNNGPVHLNRWQWHTCRSGDSDWMKIGLFLLLQRCLVAMRVPRKRKRCVFIAIQFVATILLSTPIVLHCEHPATVRPGNVWWSTNAELMVHKIDMDRVGRQQHASRRECERHTHKTNNEQIQFFG